jgi:hypothetical protein
VAACGRLGFNARSDDGGDGRTDTAGASGYHATAVRFAPASNAYLDDLSLANVSNGPKGTLSIWIHFNGSDGTQQFVAGVGGMYGLLRTASNQFRLNFVNCSNAAVVDMYTQGTYTMSSGWVHVLTSWDGTTANGQIYVNDVSDRAAAATLNNDNGCFTSPVWGIGGVVNNQLNADLGDFYVNLTTYVDLTVAANRRLFSDAAGKPVDLGPSCNLPTGSTPTACFTGPVTMWNIDKGTAGGFSAGGGGLTAAQTSPSD